MSIPVVTYGTEHKPHANMNVAEYTHSRNATLHQEQFRWPAIPERPLYEQYLPDRTASQPRTEFNRYPDLRHPYDSRSRLEMNVSSEEQQRLNTLHLQQYQRNIAASATIAAAAASRNDAQVGADSRYSFNDPRAVAMKKSNPENSSLSDAHNINMNGPKNIPHPSLDPRHPHPYASASMPPKTSSDVRFPQQNHVSESTESKASSYTGLLPPLAPPTLTLHSTVASTQPENSSLTARTDEKSYSTVATVGSNPIPTVARTEYKATETSPSSDKYESTSTPGSVKNEKEELDNRATKLSPTSNSSEDNKSPDESNDNKKTDNKNSTTKVGETSSPDNGLPSYTAMIAQAILKKENSKSTLSDIYEYMEKYFPSLEKRGTGWRNCVRHTLSLNDCFIKLHRPENGRSCNWAVHPSYFDSFSRGDYRKRRALRKRPRGLQWIDPMMLGAYPFVREHDMHHEGEQQGSPFYHYPPPNGMWNPSQGYPNPNQPSPNHLQHYAQTHQPPPPHSSLPPHYSMHPPHHGHIPNAHCINPDCYCQFNKNNYRPGYTP